MLLAERRNCRLIRLCNSLNEPIQMILCQMQTPAHFIRVRRHSAMPRNKRLYRILLKNALRREQGLLIRFCTVIYERQLEI